MKKIYLVLAVLVIVGVVMVMPAKSDIKSYYSGDAINYQGTVVVGSTNSGDLEVFKLAGSDLTKFADIQAPDSRFGTRQDFADLKFSIENNHLYVYAISGFTIFKYDISDLNSSNLVKSDTNTYWEWYNRIDKFGNDIVTISAKGVKVWNGDLQVVDNYDITNPIPYNIRSDGSDRYIFNITSDEIQVYDRTTRSVTKNLEITSRVASGNRSIYYDPYDNTVYAVDDDSAKKFDMNGALIGSFDHSGSQGFDISSSDNEYVYFSDGIGVVKLDKQTMEPLKWAYTGGINGDQGWAMGLKVVGTDSGDKVVVFNNSSILVLDDNTNLVAAVRASDSGIAPVTAKEDLFLKVNTLTASSGTDVLLNGGGFYPDENLSIKFGATNYTATADENGRFQETLTVPGAASSAYQAAAYAQSQIAGATSTPLVVDDRVDIKVTGAQSNLSYSTAFDIRNVQSN